MGKRRKNAAQGRARDRPQAMTAEQVRTRGVTLAPAYAWSRASSELAGNETIYAAVTRIANALATMPVRLYRDTEIMADDPRDALLSIRPNRLMSAFAFKRAMEGYRNTEGRAYAAKRFNALGEVAELAVLDPLRVTPMIAQETGDLWYCVTREDGVTEYLHSWYVIALHHMSTNGMHGVRVADVLRGTLQYSQDVKQFSLDTLKSVNRAVVLEFPSTMGGPRRVQAVSEMLDIYRQNGGKVIALDAGVKASMLGGNSIEAETFDVEQVTRSRVATVYNIPPHLLGVWSDTTGATAEQQNIEFLTLTMLPIVTQWQEELDYKLLTPAERRAGYAFRFDPEAYLRADGATLANLRQSQIRCGSRTPNEIRAKDYLPPVEGGDMAYLSKDLAPMALVAAGGTLDAATIAGERNSAKT